MTETSKAVPANDEGAAARTQRQFTVAPELLRTDFRGDRRGSVSRGNDEWLAIRTLDCCRWLVPPAFEG